MKLKLLKEIAEEHELDWDPAASEKELLKLHEDLLVSFRQISHAQELLLCGKLGSAPGPVVLLEPFIMFVGLVELINRAETQTNRTLIALRSSTFILQCVFNLLLALKNFNQNSDHVATNKSIFFGGE